jgi:hypothetical protein
MGGGTKVPSPFLVLEAAHKATKSGILGMN